VYGPTIRLEKKLLHFLPRNKKEKLNLTESISTEVHIVIYPCRIFLIETAASKELTANHFLINAPSF